MIYLKKFNEMKRFEPTLKSLQEETTRLLHRLIDMNFTIDIKEEGDFYIVKIALGQYWQKIPSLLKWSRIKMDIINYLHHICAEFHVCRDVTVVRNSKEEVISLKRIETLVDCQIKSMEFKIDK